MTHGFNLSDERIFLDKNKTILNGERLGKLGKVQTNDRQCDPNMLDSLRFVWNDLSSS